MLESNLLYYDDYVYFSFGDTHSSKYNLFIKNDIDELKIYLNNEGSIEYVSPKYQNNKYLLGVTRPQRVIPLTLVADGLTRAEILQMTRWLKVGNIGGLCFDFAKDWAYDVIISEISDPNIYAKDEKHFIVTFDIKWSTLNGTSARNVHNAVIKYSNIEEAFIQKEGAYNNISLLLPSLDMSYDKESNTYTAKIFYLGDDLIKFNLEHNYEDVAQIECSIKTNTNVTLQDFETSVSCKPKAGENSFFKVLSFSQRENLFFIDNFLPQQEANRSTITNLQTSYNYEPLILKSPGAPRLIHTIEELESFMNTGFDYVLIKPAVVERAKYGEVSTSAGLYPYKITQHSIITTPADIEIENDWSNYKGYYFVFCDTIKITEENNFTGLFTITQYTEAI